MIRNGKVIFRAFTPLAAAAALVLGLVLSAGAPATAAPKESKPAVAVECVSPCIDSNEIEDGGGPTLLDSLAAQLRCIPVVDHAAKTLFITSC